ncbi:hypothetical protein EOE18_01415 [Novosphingobium umbonatum]|uniref:DUF4139 domain-containing protein n=1 Tax=Novosphingobium umbonatum TaxID=1908524 RepID=A0A437NCU3_9SPHN|nr:hypothetical protein [Novosphingobium umbonatum]RVU07769.1 hypothetical protein EOE18_01415 [Novosphingobium umbonatum]
MALALAAAVLAAAPVGAPVVEAAPPRATSVTIYRAPNRPAGQALQLDWLQGYALVTEERDISLPAGEAVLRFDGVAAGMLAESALVTGLPASVAEKNLDADLLSPRNLYARAFRRPVTIKRHDPQGRVVEEEAIIRSAPDGAAVLQTRRGFEIANCAGFQDGLAYDGLPAGLQARPSLSLMVRSPKAVTARVKLSYLAWGFDWQAHYVARLSPDGRSAGLTGWVTLASSDATSFSAAQAAVVAGKLRRVDSAPAPQEVEALEMSCRVSVPLPIGGPDLQSPSAMSAPPPPPPVAMAAPMEVLVTARRVAPKLVRPEALGDVKLYRLPLPTTVAAHAQKQVALVDRKGVKLAIVHALDLEPQDGEGHARIRLVMRNVKADGLGLALPAGQLVVTQGLGAAQIPAGEATLEDKAVGETLRLDVADSPRLRMETQRREMGKGMAQMTSVIRNTNRWPVQVEARLMLGEGESLRGASAKLGARDGKPLWLLRVPAGGQARLVWRVKEAG